MPAHPRTDADRTRRAAALVQAYQDRAAIGCTFGMRLSYDDAHQAVFHLPDNPTLYHGLGDTHGGAIATLLDSAAWFAAAVEYDAWIATVELSLRLLEPARHEDLIATGRLVRAGKTLATAEAQAHTASGRLIATATGTFAVTGVEF